MSGKISLAVLKSLCALAETDDVFAAGEAAGKSSAMVSKQVSELEGSLGVRLYNRYATLGEGRLTEAGKVVYMSAQRIFEELANLEKEMMLFEPDCHDKRVFWR